MGYVDYLDEEHLNKGNSLAVGMMGMKFFYMKHDFYSGQFTKTAYPKFDGFNERIALWFISWFNKSSQKYLSLLVREFENAFNNTELIVPYKNGTIALDYIESRIRELEESRIRELEAYLKAADLEDCTLNQSERNALVSVCTSKINWTECNIGRLFSIKKGKRLTKADMIPGTINFIGATSSNNGISNTIANDTHLHPGNLITVTYNGSVGEAFYQTAPFWASDDVNVLYPRKAINEDISLFFLAPLRKKGIGYGYSSKWTKEKMEADDITVPTSNGSDIDFSFMETYIRAIKKQCIARLKEEIDHEKNVYQKAVQDREQSHILLLDPSKVPVEKRYIQFLPVYSVRAACGYFEESGVIPEDEAEGWVDVSSKISKPSNIMFIVRAHGDSMKPLINDGDLCVFEHYGSGSGGSREGTIVLTQCINTDDDYGCSYTIKKYHSEKELNADGTWHHSKVELLPLNSKYAPIRLEGVMAEQYKTIGIMKSVL